MDEKKRGVREGAIGKGQDRRREPRSRPHLHLKSLSSMKRERKDNFRTDLEIFLHNHGLSYELKVSIVGGMEYIPLLAFYTSKCARMNMTLK